MSRVLRPRPSELCWWLLRRTCSQLIRGQLDDHFIFYILLFLDQDFSDLIMLYLTEASGRRKYSKIIIIFVLYVGTSHKVRPRFARLQRPNKQSLHYNSSILLFSSSVFERLMLVSIFQEPGTER